MNITIKHPGKNDINDNDISYIAELVNRVYGEAEADLWKPTTQGRTNPADIRKNIENGQMLIAETGGKIVGVCKIAKRDRDTCEFGMLTADPQQRGKGIGRELVKAAENWGRQSGFKKMRLELLTPRHWKNESKEFLKVWYTRIGYKPAYTVPFEEEAPHRMDEFATDCDFTVWLKDLL